jgi:hypothetical protein
MGDVNFEEVYSWFSGTIFPPSDCAQLTGCNAKCCSPYYIFNEFSYIIFLPGEFEFLQNKLGKEFPMKEIKPGIGKYHCFLKSCPIYKYRPIDCRSYPYWPIINKKIFSGFWDLRDSRCPIKIIPERFLREIKNSWSKLFSLYPWLIDWLENEVSPPLVGKPALFKLKKEKKNE